MSGAPPVFDLTPLTSGAAANRRAVIKGFEFRWPTLIVGGLAVVPGLLVTMILWPFLDSVAILAVPVVIALAIWLFEGRSAKGMQLKNWQSLRNRATSSTSRFYVSGQLYEPLATRQCMIQVLSFPVDRPAGTTRAADEFMPDTVPTATPVMAAIDTDPWE